MHVNVECRLYIRIKGTKKAKEVERFSVGDLNKQKLTTFYKHVHDINKEEIERLGFSMLVNNSMTYEQSDYNLKTHNEAMESRFNEWMEKNGYHSMVDNKWLYKLLRSRIQKCAECVAVGDSVIKSKVIPREYIDSLLINHARQGEKDLIQMALLSIENGFPYAYRYDANRILIQYLADQYNPNNESAPEIRRIIPSILKTVIESNPGIATDADLVAEIDARLDSRIKRHYITKQERETIILMEITRAKRVTQPPTPSAEFKKESP